MKAIVLQGAPGKASLVTERPHPQQREGYVLVDVKAVALNPTDWKHIDYINTAGALSGCDYAGVVAETGSGYSKPWKNGDRVCGFASGANSLQLEDGAFAERIAVKADIQMRIPPGMSFEDAATLGVGVITGGQGLVQQMGLQPPSDPTTKGEFVLIYGGSSATGTIGIQLAKLAGYTVITTCSPRNFELVKALGAVAAFDYRDPEAIGQIQKLTGQNLRLVWDTISTESASKFCAQVIASGGAYGSVLTTAHFHRDDVKCTTSLGYTATGEAVHKFGLLRDDNTADFEFAKKWIAEAEGLLHQGRLKPHPSSVHHGLENVLDGLDLMRHDKVSGQKLVYVL